ncbi:MAG: hypothetical protein QGG36_28270 [Pirellulaceae bacterium]|jgi:hypothetical protein|nr:hypothetical protein [Pirellulaceae bacterium]
MKSIIALTVALAFAGQLAAADAPTPTMADVAYGDHPKQVMHFWRAESDEPTALLFFIHGGGWQGGNRMNRHLLNMLPNLLKNRISAVSIEYRFISPYALVSKGDPPVYLFYNAKPGLGQPQRDPTHTSNFGVKLQEQMKRHGVACELVYPGAPDVTHKSAEAYLIAKLRPTKE